MNATRTAVVWALLGAAALAGTQTEGAAAAKRTAARRLTTDAHGLKQWEEFTGEVCSDAKCRQYCTCDEDCGDVDVFVCDAGACLPRAEASPECISSEHCAAGQNCVDGACL